MAGRKCYGYTMDSNGELTIKPNEAQVVRWIFEQYLSGSSLGKIIASLAAQGISSPTGKSKWNRETIDKLLSNEKYTGQVLLQKTISTGFSQIQNNGFMDQYLFIGTHEAIIFDEMFIEVQKEKHKRIKHPENISAISLIV